MSRSLTATSFLVLGLLAREGPSTPYDLKRHVEATIGHFWSFPHTLLYTEPPRLEGLGLVSEVREEGGRHRRVFDITATGREALGVWLDEPSPVPSELRDIGLLQLFFADLGRFEVRARIAKQQLVQHRARLRSYEDSDPDVGPMMSGRVPPTTELWRGETLRMGVLYEQAAIAFWKTIARGID